MSSHRQLPGQAPRRSEESVAKRDAREDLTFRVELWDAEKAAVELVLAEALQGSIAYAAFNAAIREYPERYLTLRQDGRIISSCNPPAR
jgi:hypothetical protein